MRTGHGVVVCGLVLTAAPVVAQPAPAPAPTPTTPPTSGAGAPPTNTTGAFPDAADESPKGATEPAPPSSATPAPPPLAAPPDLSKQPPSAAPAAGASNASPARDQAGKTPPPKEPERTYDWNLGAGVGFGSDGGLRPGGIYAQIAVGTPSFRLALERRISGGLWLMLNGAFYYTSGEGPPYDEASSGPENVRRTLLSTGGVVGVRQAMTSGIVETSVTLGFGLGYTRIDGDPDEPQNFAGSVGPGSSAITYGFVGGLAVERELIEALALRLSASVISLSWDRATIVHETEGEPQDHVKSVTFAVDLIPAIDLRFYF